MNVKRGDLVFVFDPMRPTGSATGFRGLAIALAVDDTEATVVSLAQTHQPFRVALSTIQVAYAASFIAEGELFR
jgi:hypothetical protein